MSANRFGEQFQWTTFGESHGEAMGVVIDGCPAGVPFQLESLLTELMRRRPGQSAIVTSRNEADQPEILSGVFEGRTLGTPIAVVIKNQNQKSSDYEKIKTEPRPGHADDLWKGKFSNWDYRGGGRASARETVGRVIAGSVAKMFCASEAPELKINACVQQLGPFALSEEETKLYRDKIVKENSNPAESFEARFPSSHNRENVVTLLKEAKQNGESYGGVIQLWIDSAPAFLGQPVFHKLKNDLASAFMSIGACTGVEFGGGFSTSSRRGSETHTGLENPVYGGLRGGLSTGEAIQFQIAFKPTSSIHSTAREGRHDPCILPRAVPVVEAMAWAVMADHLLWRRLDNSK